MRVRFMGFIPKLNLMLLAPEGLVPENLAKHNFKPTLPQLAELNFLELRFSSNVKIWRCDMKMWRCENVWQTPTIRRTIRSDALGKKWKIPAS